MDLLRRAAAGELSALLGAVTVDTDRELRVHRLRAVARASLAAAPAEQRALIDAYTAGVNAGLGSLRARPFEYLVLRSAPEPWRAEDSVLATLAMFLQLQEPDGHTKIERGLVRDALPESAARFVYAASPDWEATLDDSRRRAPPVVPPAADYDLARVGKLDFEPPQRHSRSRPADRQQQLGARRRAHRERRGVGGQRHAPRHPRAEHLVPRAPARRRPGGAHDRRHRRHAARHAGGGRRAATATSPGGSPTATATSRT